MSQFSDYESDDDVVFSRPGNLARVRHISDDGCQVALEMRSGQFATATWDQPFDLDEGAVVIVHDGSLERVSDEVWTEESWVGVIGPFLLGCDERRQGWRGSRRCF